MLILICFVLWQRFWTLPWSRAYHTDSQSYDNQVFDIMLVGIVKNLYYCSLGLSSKEHVILCHSRKKTNSVNHLVFSIFFLIRRRLNSHHPASFSRIFCGTQLTHYCVLCTGWKEEGRRQWACPVFPPGGQSGASQQIQPSPRPGRRTSRFALKILLLSLYQRKSPLVALRMLSEIYRDYPRPPSLGVAQGMFLTVLRGTLTQYIKFKRGGRGQSLLLYSVVLLPRRSASTSLCG